MKSIISKLAYLDTWNQYSVIKNKIKYYICAFIIKTKKENRNKIRKKTNKTEFNRKFEYQMYSFKTLLWWTKKNCKHNRKHLIFGWVSAVHGWKKKDLISVLIRDLHKIK